MVPFGSGSNTNNQLGITNTTIQASLISNSNITNIIQIASTLLFSIYINSSNKVFGVGAGATGSFCTGGTFGFSRPTLLTAFQNDNVTSVSTGNLHTLYLLSNGDVYGCGSNNNGRLGLGYASGSVLSRQKSLVSNIVFISVGQEHSIFVNAVSFNFFS